MNRIKLPVWLVVMGMLLSACAAEAAPTVNPVDIQNTAIAAAFTVVAETQAAIPTATPIPPTDTPTPTPLPTDTPVPLPTLEATFTSAPQTSGNSDPCNSVIPSSPDGKKTKIKLLNQTNGPVVVSLYLNITPFGVCGYRGYNLGKNDQVVITDLTYGCYNVSVYVNDPKKQTKSFGYGCINNPDLWTFEIRYDFVKFVGP